MAERVPQGQIGTGEAQVLGGPSDPLKAFQYAQANQQQIAATKAAADVAKKKALDENVKEMFEYNPEATWEPFNQQVSDVTKAYFDRYVDALNKGQDSSDPEFQKRMKHERMAIDDLARKGNFLKGERQQFIDEFIDGDRGKYYHKDELLDDLNRIFYDDDFTGHPIGLIKKDSIYALTDNVDRFNMQALSKDLMSGIQTKMIEKEVIRSQNDDGVKISSETAKSKLFKINDNGTVDFLNISPDIITLAKEDPQMARYLEVKAGGDPEKEKEIIKKLFTPFDPTSQGNNVSVSGRKSGGGGGGRFSDIQINTDSDPDYREYSKIRSDGIAGRSSITVDIPKLAEGISIKNDETGETGVYTIDGFGVDSEGEAYIKARIKSDSEFFDQNVPYTPANVTLIRNTLKNDEDRKGFDDVTRKFDEAKGNQKIYHRDEARISSTVEDIMTKAFNGNTAGIQDLMAQLGFANATITSGSPGFWNAQWVSIDGKKFDYRDKEKLKSYLYDNARSTFTYEAPEAMIGVQNTPQSSDKTKVVDSVKDLKI